MKKFLFLLSLSFMQIAHAQFITQTKAKNVSGGIYNKDGELSIKASECTYTLMNDDYLKNHVRFFLNSDEEAHTNFAFSIPSELLPLRDGLKLKLKSGLRIKYNNGLLSLSKVDFDGPFSRDREIAKLFISPDLQKPLQVYAREDVRGLIRSIKFKELKCEF
jgi:hypothetical protein